MRVRLIVLLFVVVAFTSCKRNGRDVDTVNIDSIDLSDKTSAIGKLDTAGTGIPIFYNMYLSVELSSLFEASGSVFTKGILNPSDRISDYITSYKKAMNLGVYAVDLSYTRVFEQYEEAGRYFTAMQQLSEQLGIPSTYFENTAQRFERNLTNKDSLIAIANEVYYDTERYLKENERYSTSSVIILGGWVEAIYIGTHVAIESKNTDIVERLVDQKYSLNNLLIMLNEYRNNEVVAEYLELLEDLRDVFMAIEIDVPVDFTGGTEEAKAQLESWLNDIRGLQENIKIVRSKIIG